MRADVRDPSPADLAVWCGADRRDALSFPPDVGASRRASIRY